MKWFKHMSSSSEDQKISELEDEFGLMGYAVYFKTLELISKEMGPENSTSISYSEQKLKRFLGISVQKLTKIYQFLDEIQLLSVHFLEKKLEINCPNLLKFRDNHTKNLQATGKKVSLEEEIRDKSKKKSKSKSTPKPPEGDFELIWKNNLSANRKGDSKKVARQRFDSAIRQGVKNEDIELALSSWAQMNLSRDTEHRKGMSSWLWPENIKDALDGNVGALEPSKPKNALDKFLSPDFGKSEKEITVTGRTVEEDLPAYLLEE